MDDADRLHRAVVAWDATGSFGEEDYAVLRRVVSHVGRVDVDLLDGFVGLFFERHLLVDVRRRELVALPPDELVRAVRHRFRQVVSGGHDAHQAWHALSAHVREALATLRGPSGSGFPVSITGRQGFSAIAVEQAVAAVWSELGRAPSVKEATSELFARYVAGAGPAERSETGSREFPAVVSARLDAQRLARGIASLLSPEEKELLRSQLDGEPVEAWAEANGVSRATAYRLLARVKSLCRTQFDARGNNTRLAVLDALRHQL
jgi:hypothetical protein